MDLVTVAYVLVGGGAIVGIAAGIALDALALAERLGCQVCDRSRLAHHGRGDHAFAPHVRGDRYAAAIAVLVILWLALALAR